MKFQLRGWGWAGAVLVLAVFVASAIIAYLNTRALVEDQEWVSHSFRVQARLEGIWARVSEAESSERGYLVTGDERYLEPYHQALAALPGDLRDLKKLVADNASQREEVEVLEASISRRLAHMEIAIGLRARFGLEAAQRQVATDEARTGLMRIREIIGRMGAEENRLLGERVARSQQTARRTLVAGVLSSTIGVILVAFVALMALRSVRERLASAQELSESEEHLQLALRFANAWSWQYDVRTGAMKRSQDVSRFFGLPPGAIGNSLESSLSRYHPQDAARFRQQMARTIETGDEFDEEMRVIWPDGNVHWFAVRGRAVYDADRRPLHVVGINIEITDKKREEEVLRETEKMASAGRLAATLAHEINNPLEAVNSILYLLLRHGRIDDEARQHLEIANQEMGRAIEVIRNTLGLYREAAVPLTVDLAQVLDNVLALFDRTLRIKGVEVRRRYETEGRVYGYRGELRQVFINLIGNALDAMPDGGVLTVHVAESRNWSNELHRGVRATIGDTGGGVPLEIRRRLFRPFFSTKGEKGTGLGLWVSRQLVEKHGGTIRLWSRTHEGASGTWISVFLPRAEEAERLRR